MKVKTRLSLYCSLIFGIIFAIISLSIYELYYRNAEKSIYTNLEKTAYISGWFYLEEDELSDKEFEKIRKQFEEVVTGSYYQVYDVDNKIAYGVEPSNIPVSILDKIRKERHLSFTVNNYLCYGIFYEDNQGDFVIIAKEKKNVLDEQVNLLLSILIPAFFVGLLAIVILSRWVSRMAYRPFSEVIEQVKNISTNNLDVQIKSPETKDELQDLIDTFNDLLSKISETFIVQKNFVKYVSHEFKTPLASILGNLDLFSMKDRSPEEYRQLSDKLIRQTMQLEEILNTLITISDLNKNEKEIAETHMNELIREIVNKIKDIYPNSKIVFNIDISDVNKQLMYVMKDRTQLLIALFNLIENAVKYSQKQDVAIHLHKCDSRLCLSIADKGIGIPTEHLTNISRPFYRADNTNNIQGSGIGLSLALRILDKNKIDYKIESEVNVGTTITLIFDEE